MTLSEQKKQCLQSMFDKIVDHLLSQMQQARNDSNRCCYRAKTLKGDTLMCAVGCLIDDANYSPKLEDRPMSSAVVWRAVAKSQNMDFLETDNEGNHYMDGYLVDRLISLQQIHDNHPSDVWEQMLQEFAEAHELEWKRKWERVE